MCSSDLRIDGDYAVMVKRGGFATPAEFVAHRSEDGGRHTEYMDVSLPAASASLNNVGGRNRRPACRDGRIQRGRPHSSPRVPMTSSRRKGFSKTRAAPSANRLSAP